MTDEIASARVGLGSLPYTIDFFVDVVPGRRVVSSSSILRAVHFSHSLGVCFG